MWEIWLSIAKLEFVKVYQAQIWDKDAQRTQVAIGSRKIRDLLGIL